MKLNSSLPYPVLTKENDSYKDSSFEVDVQAKKTFGQLQIEAKFLLENIGIADLIAQEKAVYALHIECPQTSFRQLIKTTDEMVIIKIDEQQLRGKIDVHPFILANERIEQYSNASWNSFYSGVHITFDKGNMLAVGDAVELVLHEDPTETQNLPSIVTIRRVEKAEYMAMDLGPEQIIIQLPQKMYDQYAQYGNSRLRETILTMVILPGLIDVFHTLKTDVTAYEDCRWYQVLMQIFENNHLPFTKVVNEQVSVLEAAQLVLRNPLITSFNEIEKFIGEED